MDKHFKIPNTESKTKKKKKGYKRTTNSYYIKLSSNEPTQYLGNHLETPGTISDLSPVYQIKQNLVNSKS